jgi:sortase A
MGGEDHTSPPSLNDNTEEMPVKKHKTVIFLSFGFLVGICILLYPAFSDFWNSKTQSRAITNYETVLENLKPEDYTAIFEKAYAYNKALYETNYPLMDYKDVPGYYDTLSVTDNDMIGYLKIERIGLELPIYHGTSDDVLNKGVGHLQGSSLPVGGENTHCVMSAHRGLPSSKLFTDLDRMETGDTFQIIVLDQVLTYQVDFIKIIEPADVNDLRIIDGGDYCTLFTCTPYGINTHRLLVRGIRIETIKEKPVLYVSNEAFRIEPMLVTPAVAAPMLLVLLIHLLVKYREPPKPQEQEDKSSEQKQ